MEKKATVCGTKILTTDTYVAAFNESGPSVVDAAFE